MRLRVGAVIGVVASLALGTVAHAADYHRSRHHLVRRHTNPYAAIGSCVRTRVTDIAASPGGAPPALVYSDGVVQAYDPGLLGHTETRPGDPIQLCLVAFTRDCGGLFGHDLQPGRTYATGNLRTGAAWTLPDLRSSCARR